MLHLSFLKTDEHDSWLELAANSRKENAPQLARLLQAMRQSYNQYDLIIQDRAVDLAPTSYCGHKDLLLDYYVNPPTKLSAKIKARRNDHGLAECPYCGYPFAPDTLDHFIPKDKRPEFSIHPNNLVPQCKYCAPIKGKLYYCANDSTAMFIHPIYSDLLSRTLFKMVAYVRNRKPVFEGKFAVHAGTSSDDQAAIRKHLKHLHVKSRFEEYCLREYKRWTNKIKQNNFNISQAFYQRVEEEPGDHGFSSNWKAAFCLGALSCQELIELLQQFAPRTKAVPLSVHKKILDI
jgi:5-methylcytosine-specific restriction endonuclease McrA